MRKRCVGLVERRAVDTPWFLLQRALFLHLVPHQTGRKKGLLNAERVKLMESWEHPGFNIDAPVHIAAADATGRENLARYLIRAPFSGEKITYNAVASTVIYQT